MWRMRGFGLTPRRTRRNDLGLIENFVGLFKGEPHPNILGRTDEEFKCRIYEGYVILDSCQDCFHHLACEKERSLLETRGKV